MLANVPLTRINRFAGIAILPMMVLAIVVFSRFSTPEKYSAKPPTEGRLVVANLRSESLTLIDVRDGAQRELALPGPPHELVEVGGRLYVTLGRGNSLVEIDLMGFAILRTLHLDGEPHGLAAYGDNLIVTLDKGNEAVVVDRATMTELRRYPTGDTPHVVALSAYSVLVTDSRQDQLRELLPAARTVATGAQPEGLAIAGEWAITANSLDGSVTVARAADLSSPRTVRVGGQPVRVVALDATHALVAVQGADRVLELELPSGKVSRSIKVGSHPDGLCLTSDGHYLAVAGNGGGQVQLFGTDGWKSAGSYSLADGLGSCAWLR
jgi:DNA-binding beta-propeller fold protein YncE